MLPIEDGDLAPRTGGQILVDALLVQGVDLSFGVPGESFLAVLDALFERQDRIRFITCRQEGGVAYMAEAYGKLTGRPGVAFVTRGPGACNASIGVHTAFQDSTPMVLFVGQVPRFLRGREAFQEVDYKQMFAPLAKWVTEVDDPADLPDVVAQAFHIATSGRPGPVVVALPEDMLAQTAVVGDGAVRPGEQPNVRTEDIEALGRLLDKAVRPLVICGGSGWTETAVADLWGFVEANGLATAVSCRRQDLIDNRHELYVGDAGVVINPGLKQRILDADLILAVGCRLGEMTTQGYTLLEVPRPRQKLVHVHADAAELGRVYEADLAINAGVGSFVAAARRQIAGGGAMWREWCGGARDDYLTWCQPQHCSGKLDLAVVMAELREVLPTTAIVTNDAGNFAGWVARYFQYQSFRTCLGPTNGSMGYAVPAAIAAKAALPNVPVVAVVGDGGVLMNGQELATAAQYGLDPLIIVVDNGMYGTIRMHQERSYPGRVSATALKNPDFVAWAQAFGAYGEQVETTAEFGPALARALKAGRAAVLVLKTDPEAISTQTTITALRAAAEASASLAAKG
ncbi:MAG: thiamine pyrophosphate-binding protein [Alphaproteobacteria bacterium]